MTRAISARRGAGRLLRKQDIGLAYIAPWLVGFLVFTLYPMAASLVYCFYEFNYQTDMRFVGLANFIGMFNHRDFLVSLKATGTFVLFAVPAKLLSALLLALLLNVRLRAVNLYRTLFYLPSIIGGSVAVGILWRMMFAREGLVNTVIELFGLTGRHWLGDPDTAIYVICLLPMWQVGSSMVVLLAALKQVPAHLYEAARIDGAGRLRQFCAITLPMISPMILFNLIMQVISGFQEFSTPFIVTGGGPVKTTYFYTMFIYEEAFHLLHMGFASALSWFLFAVILVFTLVIFRSSARWTFYGDGGDAL